MSKPLAATLVLMLCAAPVIAARAAPAEDPSASEKAEPRPRPEKGHSVTYTKGGCRIEEDWDGPSHSTQVVCQQGVGRPADGRDDSDADGEKRCPPDC